MVIKQIEDLKNAAALVNPALEIMKNTDNLNQKFNIFSNDTLDRISKIIENIVKIAQMYQGKNQVNQNMPDTSFLPANNAANSPELKRVQIENGKGMEMKKELINIIKNHVNKCIKQDANMPLIKIIEKIDINATQLKIFIEMIEKL